jgi:ATP-dependent DNA ligase
VWRTPASVVVERSEDFVARVEELGHEDVVAKPLGSTYPPARRCTAWVKHKLRREERLAMTVVAATSDAVAETVFVARAARRFVGWRVHWTGSSWGVGYG